MKHDPNQDDPEGSEERIANRKAAMDMARKAAMQGDPIAGAYFSFESFIRKDPYGDFLIEFGDYMDDEDDDFRPY